MVEERITDGRRIAELFASEIDGRTDGELGRVSVADANNDVEPTVDGAHAYELKVSDQPRSDRRFARVFVHPDRIHLEFAAGQDAAVEAAEGADLRVRPKAIHPPKTLVFVESGAEVKRGLGVVKAATRALDDR